MMHTNGPAQAGMTTVASAVMRVAELGRSLIFYRDVFGCRVALREPDNALLLTRDGFQIYLHATGRSLRPRPAPIGIQYLMWATDSLAEFKRVTTRLRRHDPDTFTYTERGVTFVEGCDPDHGRVIVACPSPSRLPRGSIASRVRGTVRAPRGGATATRAANKTAARRHRSGSLVSRALEPVPGGSARGAK